jgi:hypothetical protein
VCSSDLIGEHVPDHRERGRRERRAGDSENGARGDEPPEVLGEAGEDRAGHEDDQAAEVEAAPTVEVAVSNGKYKSYSAKSRFRIPNTKRALGGEASILQMDRNDADYNCAPHALDAIIDDLEIQEADGINLLNENADELATVTAYSFARYLQSSQEKLSAFNKLCERISTSNQIPEPDDIAKFYGLDDTAALEKAWTAYVESAEFR